MRVLNWVKQNKLAILLLVVILILLFRNNGVTPLQFTSQLRTADIGSSKLMGIPESGVYNSSESYLPPSPVAPSDSTNRLVIQNSDLSLLVKNVKESAQKITDYAKETGGFMISTSLNNPNEQGTANVVIRVPSRKFKEVLQYLEGLSVKVVYENLYGEDVTDQYTDINARLQTLNTTKAKFEEILVKATEIQDILNVQREIINLQSQIDSLKGQQLYLEKSSELAKITIYLATDELELPYAPKETWRPEVIFKTAVRSLVQNLRDFASLVIWVAVYGLIWIPLLIIGIIVKSKFFKKPSV